MMLGNWQLRTPASRSTAGWRMEVFGYVLITPADGSSPSLNPAKLPNLHKGRFEQLLTTPCSCNLGPYRRFRCQVSKFLEIKASSNRGIQMFYRSITQSTSMIASICLVTFLGITTTGCVSDSGSMENAYRANLASETALNAQIISDRARDQRCQRDPGRRECGPRY